MKGKRQTRSKSGSDGSAVGVEDALVGAAKELRNATRSLGFGHPVTHVYRPLEYAWEPHEEYLRRYGAGRKKVVFLGMNPGPFGMAQTGIPFGEVSAVRDWLELDGVIAKPEVEHPKRPVEGLRCRRSEVSGLRLWWGLFAQRFPQAKTFFKDYFVANYCPLAFFEESGRNRTPDKLASEELRPLFAACDTHLRSLIELLQPDWLIGIGAFAERRAREVLKDWDLQIGRILHPSPSNPAANRAWHETVTKQLRGFGVWD